MFDQPDPNPQRLMDDVRGPKPPWPHRTIAIILAAALILVAVIGVGLYTHFQHKLRGVEQQLNKVKADPNAIAKEQNKQLLDKVSQFIVLPTDEQPTIATVSDLAKLKGQPFFAHAEIGDKVLIYNKAKKAILYRPSTNKIIELAPLTDSQAVNPPAPDNTPAP
jgi:hypothetical protein